MRRERRRRQGELAETGAQLLLGQRAELTDVTCIKENEGQGRGKIAADSLQDGTERRPRDQEMLLIAELFKRGIGGFEAFRVSSDRKC